MTLGTLVVLTLCGSTSTHAVKENLPASAPFKTVELVITLKKSVPVLLGPVGGPDAHFDAELRLEPGGVRVQVANDDTKQEWDSFRSVERGKPQLAPDPAGNGVCWSLDGVHWFDLYFPTSGASETFACPHLAAPARHLVPLREVALDALTREGQDEHAHHVASELEEEGLREWRVLLRFAAARVSSDRALAAALARHFGINDPPYYRNDLAQARDEARDALRTEAAKSEPLARQLADEYDKLGAAHADVSYLEDLERVLAGSAHPRSRPNLAGVVWVGPKMAEGAVDVWREELDGGHAKVASVALVDGGFAVDVPPGTYHLQTRVPGTRPQDRLVPTPAREERFNLFEAKTTEVTLHPPQVAKLAQVELGGVEWLHQPREVAVDGKGVAVIEALSWSRLEVRRGKAPCRAFELHEAGPKVIELGTAPPVLEGYLKLPDGSPAARRKVRAYPAQTWLRSACTERTGMSDGQGKFELGGRAVEGDYVVEVKGAAGKVLYGRCGVGVGVVQLGEVPQ